MQRVYYNSPVGIIEIKGNEEGIYSLYFVEEANSQSSEIPAPLKECVHQLEDYFTGKLRDFSVLIQLKGTPFQLKVWEELKKVPYGKTVSYKTIAKAIGDINATRAVGSANGKNPISIIVPCHRIIGTNGKLTGYGGGIWRKEWLLNHEKGVQNLDNFV